MIYNFCFYFLLFFIYCVLGYILECAYCTYKNRKLILNRGFLIGPYLPIYGSGSMIMVLFLKRYINDPVALFILAAVCATILEYITSYVMEKIFHARWWNYSNKKYNINGRVCLENTILFGIGSLSIIYIFNPFFEKILYSLSNTVLIISGIVFFIIFLLDLITSSIIIYKISKTTKYINKDISNKMNQKVQKLLKKNFSLKVRLLNAFPDIKELDFYKKISEIMKKNNL